MQEVLVSSVVLVLLCVTLVAPLAHYPFYPCCFHQLSYAIRHWNFIRLPPSQPKEFWGYSYVTGLVAVGTGMRDENARDVHNLRGRKSDVTDCEWLRELHSVGLSRASFRPAAAIVPLRSFLRQRQTLVEEAATRIQRMQKALTEMNLKLHTVLTDLTGQTGLRIVRSILAGERDPERLAAYRDYHCHASQVEIVAALTGNYRAEHLFALGQNFAAYEFLLQQIAKCDTQIEGLLLPRRPTTATFGATAGGASQAGFQASAPIRYPRPTASAHRRHRPEPD